ncbi:unnamed protein product [Urochloa humidicola]
MSFRRFVYLVMDDMAHRDFPLRRIDASRLFFPKGERPPPVPPPLEDVRLPPAAIRFSPPPPPPPPQSPTPATATWSSCSSAAAAGAGGAARW